MHRELVERRNWLSEQRFLHALNYCMILPGPEAQQLAIYIGWLMHRTWGGIVAGTLFVIPSIFILLALSYIYAAYGSTPAIASVMVGFKPVVVAIVVEALVKIGKRALRNKVHYAIAAAAFVAIFFLHVPFPLVVLGAALFGLIGSRFLPQLLTSPDEKPGKPRSDEQPEHIIDGRATEHTSPDLRRTLTTIVVVLALWTLPFAIVIALSGYDSIFAQEYRFFSVSALVTFGGAYAVLAYVSQTVTAAPYDWITPAQAIDGLALAETTPGPLIMVLQFVGFMAAWNNPVAGLTPAASGIVGAFIATYTTFLPSFLFIFLGAPYIERLRGSKVLSYALSGVTAAVVGVILNLTLIFGAAVILPDGASGNINWFAAILSVAAFIVLFRFKIDVVWVVLGGGLLGFLVSSVLQKWSL